MTLKLPSFMLNGEWPSPGSVSLWIILLVSRAPHLSLVPAANGANDKEIQTNSSWIATAMLSLNTHFSTLMSDSCALIRVWWWVSLQQTAKVGSTAECQLNSIRSSSSGRPIWTDGVICLLWKDCASLALRWSYNLCMRLRHEGRLEIKVAADETDRSPPNEAQTWPFAALIS